MRPTAPPVKRCARLFTDRLTRTGVRAHARRMATRKPRAPLTRGAMIARLRRARGWTQQRLADEAGLSRQYIYQIESSRRDGSVRALESIADAIGVPLDDLRAA